MSSLTGPIMLPLSPGIPGPGSLGTWVHGPVSHHTTASLSHGVSRLAAGRDWSSMAYRQAHRHPEASPLLNDQCHPVLRQRLSPVWATWSLGGCLSTVGDGCGSHGVIGWLPFPFPSVPIAWWVCVSLVTRATAAPTAYRNEWHP